MKTIVGIALATSLQLLSAAPALATITTWDLHLTNAQEPAVTTPTKTDGTPRPASFGEGIFTLDDATPVLTYSITVFNIDFTGGQTADTNDNLLAAHIHAGAQLSGGGTFPVAFGFIGNPFNDNNPNDVLVTPFSTGVGGTVSGKWDAPEGNGTTLSAQIANLLAGRAYVNFHTSQFPGGEIRAAFTAVPEPSAWALMIGGFGLIGAAMRRQRSEAAVIVG